MMLPELQPPPEPTLPPFRWAVRSLRGATTHYVRGCALRHRDELRGRGVEAVVVEQYWDEELYVYRDVG